MKKKEREKRTLSLLGFKTLNIKSRDQIFPPPKHHHHINYV